MPVSVTPVIRAHVSCPTDRDELLRRIGSLVPRPSRLDTLCLAGLVAAREALEAADLEGAQLGAAVLGTAHGCTATDIAFYTDVLERGPKRANPRRFAYTLPNVVLGEIAIAFGMTCDNLCISAGRASAVMALGEAASLLGPGCDHVLALALELNPTSGSVLGAERTGRETEPEVGFGFGEVACGFVVSAAGCGVRVVDYRAGFDRAGFGGGRGIDEGSLSQIPAPGRIAVSCPLGYHAELVVEV